jgi:hypothetical protein
MRVKVGRVTFEGEKLYIVVEQYTVGGNIAVSLFSEDGQPYARVSENHRLAILERGEFVLQTRNFSHGLLMTLSRSPAFVMTQRFHKFGTYRTVEPIWRLSDFVLTAHPEIHAKPVVKRCPHGNRLGECNPCDVEGDLAYDAARERK